ncbi:MAG: CRISPR-associated helicase Cas3' [Oculatellaceae cyanobacterium bins.114]|nr:CRISPR-associated helicase Cas3' [Oculatellaceae cyanobacterium bins.114]
MVELEQIDQLFEELLGEGKYPRKFQRETIAKILKQQNVLLRAPTGSGKTETAIAPFLFAKVLNIQDFPNKLIYIVPLRTLATSLRDRTKNYVTVWEKIYPPKRPLVVTLQTGENPEDPRFEGDIVFCTIDQLLSSFLSIPYSVGRGSANVNAGVVFASYLVFDELHLLDPDRSFATTLKLLEQVQGISPYLLMTATLTHELAQQIQQEVTPRKGYPEDVLHLVNVEGDDLAKIEGSRKRLFNPSPEPLRAEVILQDIQKHDRKRVIVICNTVAKSQSLFQDLREIAPGHVLITLLHSRFLPEDRKKKEEDLQRIFAEGWRKQDEAVCQILISTQVVEAGINITSEVMHTQLCPMNALLQRAGRCARFRGESGQVVVYRQIWVGDERQALTESEDDDEAIAQAEGRSEKISFMPYKNNQVCEGTWDALLEHQSLGKADLSVGFAIEENWINQVHGEEDQTQAGKRSRNKSQFEIDFDDAVFQGKRNVAENLIRHVDNRSVFMIEDPTMIDLDVSNDVDVKQLQPFSLPRTTLIKIWHEYLDSHDQTWLFKKVVPPEGKSGEGYTLPKAQPVKTQKELTESIRLVVNPKYVEYDRDVGLQIGVHIDGSYQSPKKKPKAKVSKEYSYQMDTYLGHLGRMWTCWERDFAGELLIDGKPTPAIVSSSSAELSLAGGRFIARKFFPQATLAQTTALFELLVFLAVITHDLGKLQVKWQEAMGGWQRAAYALYQSLSEKPAFKITNPANQLLAHTDHHPEHDGFKKAYEDYTTQNPRPSHAVESAFITFKLLDAALAPILESQFQAHESQVDLICHTVEMAAGRHHSAWAKGWDDSDETIHLHPKANEVIQQSWRQLSKRLEGKLAIPDHLPEFERTYDIEEFKLGKKIREDDLPYQQLYWLVVRALRICDGRSVQLH